MSGAWGNPQEALRYLNIQVAYNKVIYQRSGERLAQWSLETKDEFGYLRMHRESSEAEITCGQHKGQRVRVPIIGADEACSLKGNLKQSVVIYSPAFAVFKAVIQDFNKGKPLGERLVEPEENELPVLAGADLPHVCLQHFVYAVRPGPPLAPDDDAPDLRVLPDGVPGAARGHNPPHPPALRAPEADAEVMAVVQPGEPLLED